MVTREKGGGGGRAQRGKWCTHNMTNKNVQLKSHKVVIYHNINKKKLKKKAELVLLCCNIAALFFFLSLYNMFALGSFILKKKVYYKSVLYILLSSFLK